MARAFWTLLSNLSFWRTSLILFWQSPNQPILLPLQFSNPLPFLFLVLPQFGQFHDWFSAQALNNRWREKVLLKYAKNCRTCARGSANCNRICTVQGKLLAQLLIIIVIIIIFVVVYTFFIYLILYLFYYFSGVTYHLGFIKWIKDFPGIFFLFFLHHR